MLVALLAAACLPFGGLQTDRIARSENTVTEYFEGAYRVTSCDSQGRAERTTTMARILTPTAVAPFVVIEEQTARTRWRACTATRTSPAGHARGCAPALAPRAT